MASWPACRARVTLDRATIGPLRLPDPLHTPIDMPTFLRRIAPITGVLILVNLGLFLYQVATGISPTNPELDDLGRWGANIAALTLTGESWRLLASMFLHIGVLHLALNMISLLFLGSIAERNFGKLNYLLVYFLSGLGGSLVSALWNARPQAAADLSNATPTIYLVVSAGASGAVMGLAAAAIMLKLLKNASREPLALPFSAVELAVLVGINVVYGWQTNGTDNACHIGGLLAGAVVGLVLGAVRNTPRPVRIAAWLLVLVAAAWGTQRILDVNEARADLMEIREELDQESMDNAKVNPGRDNDPAPASGRR